MERRSFISLGTAAIFLGVMKGIPAAFAETFSIKKSDFWNRDYFHQTTVNDNVKKCSQFCHRKLIF